MKKTFKLQNFWLLQKDSSALIQSNVVRKKKVLQGLNFSTKNRLKSKNWFDCLQQCQLIQK